MRLQDKEFVLEVVDLAKDPKVTAPLAWSTIRNSKLDEVPVLLEITCNRKASGVFGTSPSDVLPAV